LYGDLWQPGWRGRPAHAFCLASEAVADSGLRSAGLCGAGAARHAGRDRGPLPGAGGAHWLPGSQERHEYCLAALLGDDTVPELPAGWLH
ncbi:unnamed protein product, partial [Effrenium voratum]